MEKRKEITMKNLKTYEGYFSRKDLDDRENNLQQRHEEQTWEEYQEVYDDAPQEVQDLIEEYGEQQDYQKLAVLRGELNKLGYDIEYGLSGEITSLIEI